MRAEIYPNGKFGSIAVKVLTTILRRSFFDDCYCIVFCPERQQLLPLSDVFGNFCWFTGGPDRAETAIGRNVADRVQVLGRSCEGRGHEMPSAIDFKFEI